MALKPYKEMRTVDVSKFVEQRDKMDYINWAQIVELLHENGAETVYFEPLVNEKGSSLFMTDQVFTDKNGVTNRCYEVGVKVVVDDNTWEFRGPLMNGANPVKDNSISQQRIWNCQTRLFVKCIAIHTGLGFNLWLKEEQETEKADKWDDVNNHSLAAVKERIERLITLKMDGGLSAEEIAVKAGLKDADEMREYIRMFKRIHDFETKLRAL